MLAAAEAEARAASDELRSRLRAEVAALEEARNRLRSEITLLEQHLAARRDSLIEAADNLRVLAGETLSGEPVPELAPLELPDETLVLKFNERSHEEPAADPPDLETVPDLGAPDLAESAPLTLPPPLPTDEGAGDEPPTTTGIPISRRHPTPEASREISATPSSDYAGSFFDTRTFATNCGAAP